MRSAHIISALLLLALVYSDASGQLFRRPARTSGATVQRTSAGRYCNSPFCSMCNRLFGLMPGYAYINGKVTYVGRQAKPAESKPVTALDATPQPIVDVMLFVAGVKPDDVLLDPGCGDARFLISAARKYHCIGIGAEINPKMADEAEVNVREAGVSDRVLIVRGDATKHRFDIATVVVVYLFPDTIKAMQPTWPNARVVVSYMHEIPGVESQRLDLTIGGQDHSIFIWRKP